MDDTYTYRKSGWFFAQHAEGLEPLVIDELHELGVEKAKPAFRGVFFKSDIAGLYRVNYRSRLISRILAPLLIFDCHSTRYLYKTAKKIDWSGFMTVNTTFAVSATVSNSKIRHSQYAALCLKDSIVDFFRDHYGERPDVDTDNPDIRINLRIYQNRATVSLDTSNGSLHRRGYRSASVEAPMQETLAATIIKLSGWDGSRPLYDPLCGSGTLLSEALMKFSRIPSGFFRNRFGFESMPEFDNALWAEVKRESDLMIGELSCGLISGSDISAKAVSAAKENIGKLPGGGNVCLVKKDFKSISGLENTVIVCNPPYGIRCGKNDNLAEFYHSFGEFLKHRCTGAEAFIYLGARSMLKHMALRKSWKKELKNGGLDGILVKFELY